MRYRFIIVFLVVVVASCSQPEVGEVTVDQKDQPISADKVVTLGSDAFGCKTKLDLLTAEQQYQKHEFAAWARTTSTDNGCFNGPPPGLKWTVYEIDYPAVSVGFASQEQYEAAKDTYSNIDLRGVYWVSSGFVNATSDTPASKSASTVVPAVNSGGWTVQLAVFSDQSSANALRDRLQKLGFTGYVDSLKSGNKTLWRASAGPVAAQDAATTLRTQIAQRIGINGIIVPKN